MNTGQSLRLLLVGNDDQTLTRVRDLLGRSNGMVYHVDVTSSHPEALLRLGSETVDAVVIDHGPDDGRAFALIRDIRGRRETPIVLVTDRPESEVYASAAAAGADDCIEMNALTGPLLERSIRYAIVCRAGIVTAHRSEARFRALIEHSADLVAITDADGLILYAGPSLRQMLGYEERELIGQPWMRYVLGEDLAIGREAFARSLAQPGVPVRVGLRAMHKDGGWRALRAVCINHLDEPAIGGLVVNLVDDTERERARRQRTESEDLFRAIFAEASDAILIANDDGEYVAANHAAAQLLGLPAEEIVGRRVRDFLSSDVDVGTAWRVFLAEGRTTGTYRITAADGTSRDAEFSAVANVIPGRHLSILRDISPRVQAEEALRRESAKLQGLFDSRIINVTFSNDRGEILDANDAFLSMVGRSRHELGEGKLTWAELTPPEFIAINERALAMARLHGYSPPFEKQYVRPDGSRVWALLGLTQLPNMEGIFAAVSIDVTRHKVAEQALFESEQKFSTIFASSPHGIYIARTGSGEILEANPAFSSISGYSREALLGRSTNDLAIWENSAGRELIVARLSRGEPVRNIETELRRESGERRRVLLSLDRLALPRAPDLLVAFVTDVTERHGLEEQLRQAQKMEAVGRLAGGIAHDFNNLLTAILGYAELAALDASASADLKADIREIHKAGTSAAGLTRQLLAFSRRQVLQARPLELNSVVTHVQSILRRVVGEDITLTTSLDPAPATVMADPGQIEQILLNLAVNSRDAMPSGGELRITTSTTVLDAAFTASHRGARPGPHVQLSVVDTGAGMDDSVMARIFEPFFTTKESGKGTGLGLATVYGAIKQMNGFIWCTSEPGRGTTFDIYLPAIEQKATESAPTLMPASLRGTETVLIVEDQEEVRGIASKVLELHGYSVLQASGPREALDVAIAHGAGFDLLITDVVLPEMSGRELVRLLATARPTLRVLYISGYTDDAIVHHGVLDEGLAFLQKPFTPGALLEAVRAVLDASTPPTL